MCLTIDKTKTTPPDKKYMWKVMWDDMTPLYMYTIRKYKLGQWYNSNRKSKRLTPNEVFYNKVDPGIHVFLTRKAAREFRDWKHFYIIVKVEVDPKDWVASGRTQAVYTRVKPVAIVR